MADGQPVQISKDWWMAMAPNGSPYYHNTTTGETTWLAPMLSAEASIASHSTNQEEALRQSEQQTAQTVAAQHYGVSSGVGQSQTDVDRARSMMMSVAAPTAKRDITATGNGHIPAPWLRFEDCTIDKALMEPMLKAGFATPTAIQSYAWPIGVEGRDMIGVAKTGSGKTLGFLLPAFAKILSTRMRGGPLMLVLAPTRELAVQIDQDAKKFLGHAGVTSALAYGGAPKRDQLQELRNRPQLLTATPGRLNDFLEAGQVDLRDICYVCMDEADRMLDMGFEPQIRKILEKVPRRRQTYMFTATWPKEVRDLAWDFLYDPVEIRVGDADALRANDDIEQIVEVCRDIRDKEDRLARRVRACSDQTIVFTATKKGCESVGNMLYRAGVGKVETIHGDRSQESRDKALGSFKAGQARVLIATDVAARGLDVKTIRLVVNFDPANNAEDYVHRIGRTARAGMTGTAVSFLLPNESKKAADIVDVMEKTGKTVPPELKSMADQGRYQKDMGRQRYGRPQKGKGKGGGGGDRDRDDRGGYGGGGGGYGGGGGGYDRGGGGSYGGGYGGRDRSRSRSRGYGGGYR